LEPGSQITFQFLAEAQLLSAAGCCVWSHLAYLVLPGSINYQQDLHFVNTLPTFDSPSFAILVLVVGLIAGSYPAFVLSNSNHRRPEKQIRVGGSNYSLILVTLQFGLSIALIICTVIILQQSNS